MANLANINSLDASLSQISGFMNPKQNKKELLNAFNGYIMESDSISSVILMGCVKECENQGLISLVANKSENLHYMITDKDMMLSFVDGKAKLLLAESISEIQKYKYTYDTRHGNFITMCSGKTTCIEKIAAAAYLKVDVESIREYELHHKSLRCINLPETLALLTKGEHDAGHKIVGGYARNQCIYIDKVEQFKEFINKVEQQRQLLSQKDFGLEF